MAIKYLFCYVALYTHIITITRKEIVHRDLQNLSSKKFEFFKLEVSYFVYYGLKRKKLLVTQPDFVSVCLAFLQGLDNSVAVISVQVWV